jgi:chemotaxis protein methyltransferase CheR
MNLGIIQPKTILPPSKPELKREMPTLMNDTTFREFRDFIYNHSGIYFSDAKKELLESRIMKRLTTHKLFTYEEYFALLQSPAGRVELPALYESITINETYFFRTAQQFEVMEQVLLPEIIRARQERGEANPTIKIWSAAASSGEEAYTIAVVIAEKIKPLYPNVKFQIIGTDINNSVIETARSGVYKEYAVRNIPQELLKKYFTIEGNNYHLSPEIRSSVSFHHFNLFDDAAMNTVRGIDVIFCCNVLIYFDVVSKKKVIENLYKSLDEGGYLFVGYSESLHGLSNNFKLVHLQKAMAYQKT